MQSTSALYKTLFSQSGTYKEWRISVNGTQYGQTVIVKEIGNTDKSPKVSRPTFLNTPSIGSCYAAQFTCTFYFESSNIPRMATVIPSYRLCNGNQTSEWITLGTFYVDVRSYDKASKTTELVCYDDMLKTDGAEGKAYSELTQFDTWPQSMSSVVQEICDIIGVTLDSRSVINTGTGYAVEYPNDYTMREVLGFIAAAHGGNFVISPAGALRLVPITGSTDSVVSLGYQDLVLSEAFPSWSKVILYYNDKEAYEAGTDTGRVLEAEDPWAKQSTASGILSAISGSSYIPFSVSACLLDPSAEIGDTLTFLLGQNTTVSVKLWNIELFCDATSVSSIGAPGESAIDHEYPYVSSSARQMRRMVKLGQPYFGVTISRNDGIRIERSDGTSEVLFNSEVFSMRALIDGVMKDRIYFDPISGDFVFDGSLGDLTAQIAQYIDSDAGTAKIIAACSGTYQTIADMSGYVTSTSLNSRIGQYIDTPAGTAKIVAACEGTFQTINDMEDYVLNSSLNASIGAYIDGSAGTAKVIQACSGTYQTVAGMTGYVTSSSLNTNIGQYIDSNVGTAKIIAACSGTYQTQSDMTNYVQNSSLDASIGAYIDGSAGTAKVIQACEGTYQTVAGMTGYVTSTSLNTRIGQYVDTNAGTAKIVAACAGTYQTVNEMDSYVLNSTLDASIGAYIDGNAGTAKVISACEGTYQTVAGMAGYVTSTNLNTSIGQYIDTEAGTAKIVAACSGTYQTQNDMSNYVQSSTLDASIGSYIDGSAGTAKVISACSGTYQTVAGMTGYVTSSSLDTKIGQYIDSNAGTAKIVAACSGTYQTQAGMSGYVMSSSLDTSIGQYIDSQTGTAKIISVCSGTYQTQAGMSGYVTSSSLNTSIGQYMETETGTAKIVAACSSTYQTQAGMSSYVLTSNLNTSIGQYIDSTAGTAKVVSACSSTYQTQSGMSTYAKKTEVTTEISQSVSPIQSAISLTASYGSGTVGSNVRALLQLVSNADSSSITIKADKINFTGFTTFLRPSDVGSSGSTSIDGGRISTGTISAQRIDADSLRVKRIYSPFTDDVTILYCTGTSTSNSVLHLGAGDDIADTRTILIQALDQVLVGRYSTYSLVFDTGSYCVYPYTTTSSAFWKLGKVSNPFAEVVTQKIVLAPDTSHSIDLTIARSSSSYTLSPSVNNVLTIGSSSYQLAGIYTSTLTAGTSISTPALTVDSENPLTTMKASYSTNTYKLTFSGVSGGCTLIPSVTAKLTVGNSSYVLADIYTRSAHICDSNSAAKISFFGATAIAKQTISLASNNMSYTSVTASNYLYALNNLIGILKNKYGLIG